MKLTKIVATLGPSSDAPETIEEFIKNGVDVFRFNFKHNTVSWHDKRMRRMHRILQKVGGRVGLLLDLQGPEIRIRLPVNDIVLKQGERLLLTKDRPPKTGQSLSVSHPQIISSLSDGQRVVVDDGAFTFQVVRQARKCYLESRDAGRVRNNTTLNIPGADFPIPLLLERDYEGLRLAKKWNVDFIALSFVRRKKDLVVLRGEMKKRNVQAQVVSKIETKQAIDHLQEIIEASDAVMVARGDLGVELPQEEVPYYQKTIIHSCIEKRKPVITATQMLESMIDSPRPTRAEVSDVANATYDLTDAVMLSAETATGKYPVDVVRTMNTTASFNETKFDIDTRLLYRFQYHDQESTISNAAYDLYLKMHGKNAIRGFLVFTQTGRTARLLSMFRPRIPIFAVCPTEEVTRHLILQYGVYPLVQERRYKKKSRVYGEHIRVTMKDLLEKKLVLKGQQFIALHGDRWAEEGGTSTIRIVTA